MPVLWTVTSALLLLVSSVAGPWSGLQENEVEKEEDLRSRAGDVGGPVSSRCSL